MSDEPAQPDGIAPDAENALEEAASSRAEGSNSDEIVAEESAGDDDFELDDVDVKDLLRSALRPPSSRTRTSKIRRGVQQRIREQSRGRYFADGWSVTKAPKVTFLVTTLLMLLLTLLAWAVLSPIGVEVFTGVLIP